MGTDAVGHMIEKTYGKKQMLFIYFTSIVTSSLLSLVTSQGSTITAGASGGIFGLIGALTVYLFTSGLYKVPAVRASMIRTITINLMISLSTVNQYVWTLRWFNWWDSCGDVCITSRSFKISEDFICSVTCVYNCKYVYFQSNGDEKFFPLNPKLDHVMIETYDEIGLSKHAKTGT